MGRFFTWFAIGTLILAVLVLGGDFAARWYASDRVATAAQNNLKLAEKPTVSFSGWPFTPMLVKREFSEMRVSADKMSVPLLGARYDIAGVQVQLERVKLGEKATEIGQLRGRATMPFTSLGAMTSAKVSSSDGGNLKLIYSFPVAGVPSEVAVVAKPKLDVAAQRIVFESAKLTVNGVTVSEELMRQLLSALAHPVRISVGTIRVTGVTVTESGLVADVTAENYQLPPLQ